MESPYSHANRLLDYFMEVARGNVPGESTLIIRGHKSDIDASENEHVWEGDGDLSYLSSAETMNITSTAAADDDGSTGVESVLVSGVDGSGDLLTETVTMNGTSNVLTSGSFLRVNSIVALTCGSGGTNAGDITATASSAGTLQCEMDAGEGISQNSQYTVPNGYALDVVQVELNASKVSGGGTPVVEFRGLARSSASAPWLQLFDKKMDTGVQDELDILLPFPFIPTAGYDVRMNIETDTANTEARSRMYGILREV